MCMEMITKVSHDVEMWNKKWIYERPKTMNQPEIMKTKEIIFYVE